MGVFLKRYLAFTFTSLRLVEYTIRSELTGGVLICIRSSDRYYIALTYIGTMIQRRKLSHVNPASKSSLFHVECMVSHNFFRYETIKENQEHPLRLILHNSKYSCQRSISFAVSTYQSSLRMVLTKKKGTDRHLNTLSLLLQPEKKLHHLGLFPH